MARSGSGSRALGAVFLVTAFYAAVSVLSRPQPTAFAPLRSAVAAGALLAGTMGGYEFQMPDAVAAEYGGLDSSSVQVAVGSTAYQGPVEGGLDGTYKAATGATKLDYTDDEKALAKEAKFEEKFDSYVGVFAVLFVGAFIAPMVTYFWYVRDDDPWVN